MERIVGGEGVELAVERVGAGPPVLMLHGSGGGTHSWRAVAEQLADRYEMWLPARRHHSPSGDGAGRHTFAREIADVRALLDAAAGPGRTPVHLVGGSAGATVALHAAAADPAGIASLTVYEPPLHASGPRLGPVLERYRATEDPDVAARIFALEVAGAPPALVEAMPPAPPDVARRSLHAQGHELEAFAADDGDPARFAGITVPVLLMQGAETWDPVPAVLDGLAAALPHAHRAVLPGQSHFATATAPELVAARLAGFLAEVDGAERLTPPRAR